jgi:hypothetical protein
MRSWPPSSPTVESGANRGVRVDDERTIPIAQSMRETWLVFLREPTALCVGRLVAESPTDGYPQRRFRPLAAARRLLCQVQGAAELKSAAARTRRYATGRLLMARCKALCGHGGHRARIPGRRGGPGGCPARLLVGVWRSSRRRQGCRCAARLRSALSRAIVDCGRVARGYAARRGWADSEARSAAAGSRIMRR